MKKTMYWTLTIVMVLGMVLTACGGTETVVEEPAVEEPAVEAPAEEPAEEPAAEEAGFDYAALDAAYSVFIADMEAYNTIGLDALNTMLAEDPPFLLDVRSAEEAEGSGHIPGAILIPLRELGANLNLLPSFDTTIVAYCGSGWRCTIALTYLEGMGWEDVKCLKGGSFGGWAEAGYEVAEGAPAEAEVLDAAMVDPAFAEHFEAASAAIPEGWGGITAENFNIALGENADLVVFDVRTEGEVEEKGYIEAANWANIPLQQFIDMKDMWPADLDTPVVIYCGSGHRSTIAMAIMWSYGYTNVTSLKGGFGGWSSEGYPTAGGAFDLDAAYSAFLADMEAYNTIGLDALNAMMVEETPYIADMRSSGEVEGSGHIPGAVFVPITELTSNLAYLPSFDTTVVTYCGSGWRCTVALTLIEMMGWENVLCLKGGSFGGWAEGGYEVVEGLPAEGEMLNAATVDPRAIDIVDSTLAAIPEGWGGITAEDFNTTLVETPDVFVIDVRRAEELENGVIEAENFVAIPLEQFIEMKDMWPADLETPIVVYCGSGHRSTIAMTILYSYGYTDVLSLKGGFGGWSSAGFPVGEYAAP